MLNFIILFFTVMISVTSYAKDVHVNGYYKKNGAYVEPHYRSSPDSSKSNNWSTQGNYNPYTGKQGTVDVDDGV